MIEHYGDSAVFVSRELVGLNFEKPPRFSKCFATIVHYCFYSYLVVLVCLADAEGRAVPASASSSPPPCSDSASSYSSHRMVTVAYQSSKEGSLVL